MHKRRQQKESASRHVIEKIQDPATRATITYICISHRRHPTRSRATRGDTVYRPDITSSTTNIAHSILSLSHGMATPWKKNNKVEQQSLGLHLPDSRANHLSFRGRTHSPSRLILRGQMEISQLPCYRLLVLVLAAECRKSHGALTMD